jgi:hypothetical protein
MASTAIWQGFDHQWRVYPHRLNGFGSRLDNLSEIPNGGARGDYITRMLFGDLNGNDDANTYAKVIAVDSPSLHFLHGEVSISIAGQIGCIATHTGVPLSYSLVLQPQLGNKTLYPPPMR